MAGTNNRDRVLLIGLDSADADLIREWCSAGHLPTLASLIEDGTWAPLETTADVMHVSAWPTLYTGARPGHHGMYHAYQIRAGDQDVHRTMASEMGLAPFWKELDQGGVECTVLDAFMTSPVEGFRGIQIHEYGTWTWFEDPVATPEGIWRELQSRFGAYPAPEHTKVHGQPDPTRFRDQLVAGARVKGEVTRWLMDEKPWHFLFTNFGEPHPAGHYLWHVQDTAYPTHLAVPGLERAVLDVYRAVDDAIAHVLEGLGDSDTVIVTSGDGMGPNFSGCHLVPEALHRLDLYHGADVGRAKSTPGGEAEDGAARPRRGLASMLRGMVPVGLRRAVSRCLPPGLQHRLSMKWANADIDWGRTRAFCIPNANEAYVRLNLAGREPNGNVDAGAQRDELVAELQAHLGELVNPTTGLVGAQRVIHTPDVWHGDRLGDLPDVVVTWNEEAQVLADLESERCGPIRLKAGHETAPFYTGNHRATAFALARGPGVASGTTLEGGHIVDLAPTLLAAFGVERAPWMEGTVRAGLVGGAARGAVPR
jgi:predicted AlkP superfamily phosphohydrolase/phosphomutase